MRRKELVFFMTLSCGGQSASEFYHAKIKETDHIPYVTPMSYSSAGSFVFNGPSQLQVYLPPGPCISTDLIRSRPLDETGTSVFSLHQRDGSKNEIEVDNATARQVFDQLGNGSVVIKVGIRFGDADRVYFKWSEPTLNYIEPQALIQHFQHADMPSQCHEIYRKYAFTKSALKVDRLIFKFRDTAGGWIALTSENVGDMVDIGAGVEWHIENGTTLIIDTPKHIGYQLGKFSFLGDSINIKTAKEAKDDSFIWED